MDSESSIEVHPSQLPENLPDFTGYCIDEGNMIIQKRLDAGSFGSVYLASSTGPDAVRYAVKCMPKLDLNDSRRCQLQVNEIALHTVASSHPNIVTLHKHTISEDSKYLFLILDYARDGDLQKCISTFIYDDDKIKDAMCQIIDAVQHLHDIGIYHRDLKLENILIDGDRYMVADLGLATTEALNSGYNCGSMEYISPESMVMLYAESEPFKSANRTFFCAIQKDIWSLGVIFFNLMTSQFPWLVANETDLNYMHFLKDPRTLEVYYDLSSEAHHVLMGMLNTDPNKRRPLAVLKAEIIALKTFYSSKTPSADSLLVAPPPLSRSKSISSGFNLAPITPESRTANISVIEDLPELSGDATPLDEDRSDSSMPTVRQPDSTMEGLQYPSKARVVRRRIC